MLALFELNVTDSGIDTGAYVWLGHRRFIFERR
jgi:hypothetical protein